MESSNIRIHWDWVKPLLEKLHARDGVRGVTDWIPEDIYAACITGNAFFYVVTNGFLVCQQLPINNSPKSELFVWVACSIEQDYISAIDLNQNAVVDLARSIGASQVAFCTTRKGYEKVASEVGYRFAYSKYVMEV